jgi:acyl-CoA synthetase (AMP-forming)/AMP-acid ligase II
VVAIEHPRWGERPLAVIVPKPQFHDRVTKDEILAFLETRFATWWLPDDVLFVDAIPKTSVGKFDKKVMRARFKQ